MAEPVTLAETKAHLRLDDSFVDDDTYIINLIVASRQWVENYIGRSLIVKTIDYQLTSFPLCSIKLAYGPVTSVTSIKYLDVNGDEQTLATTEYMLYWHNEDALISLKYGKIWPLTLPQPNAITIKYVTGYATPSDIPQAIKQAMFLVITDIYENRQAQFDVMMYENKAVCSLLSGYNFWGGM